jgi:glutamate-1-semialdehyde aminotransferase
MPTEEFVRAYTARTPRSRQLWEEARGILPGGVSGNAKFFRPHPIYIEEASGSRVVDVDGNVYIDVLAGAGSAILGHAPEAVKRAVATQLEQGISPIFATELEIRLARKVTTHMPYMDMARFVNRGSEATFLLARTARAFTGKERIAKFEGNYHGQHDFGMEKVVTPTKEPSDVKEKIFASGTFSGNPVSMVAGLAMISELERGDIYDTLAQRGQRLRARLRDAGRRQGLELQASGIGSIFHVHFAGEPIHDKRSAMRADPVRQYAFRIGMISKGVLLPPAHPGFLSTAHSEGDVDEVLRVAGDVLREMAC